MTTAPTPGPTPPEQRLQSHHVLERLDGLSVVGWAASDTDVESNVTLWVDGQMVPAPVVRERRQDVADSLCRPAHIGYGYRLRLPPEIWASQGELRQVQVQAAGVAHPLPQVPELLAPLRDMLADPSHLNHGEALTQLLSHARAQADLASPTPWRADLDALLHTLGWTLDGPWVWPDPVQGHVDRFDGLTISGWVVGARPEQEGLSVWMAGRLWPVPTRRFPRSDVDGGRHSLGFEVDLPSSMWAHVADVTGLPLEVRLLADGQMLGGQMIHLDARRVTGALRQHLDCARSPLWQRPIAEQLQTLNLINHGLALRDSHGLEADLAAALRQQTVAWGLLQADVNTPMSERKSPDPEDLWLWRALKSFNAQVVQAWPSPDQLREQIESVPESLRQRWLMAITPWCCAHGLADALWDLVEPAAWQALLQERSPWSLSLALPWLLHTQQPEAAMRACQDLAQVPAGWVNTECLQDAMQWLCEAGRGPEWQRVRQALVLVLLGDGAIAERRHDQHLIQALWCWLHHEARCPAPQRSDAVQDLLDCQGLNPGFWQARPQPAWPANELTRQVDTCAQVLQPLWRQAPSAWPPLAAATQDWITRCCLRRGPIGAETRRIVRDWASHLSTLDRLTPAHQAVGRWLQAMGATEPLRWAQDLLSPCTDLCRPEAQALDLALGGIPAGGPGARALPASALRVIELPVQALPANRADNPTEANFGFHSKPADDAIALAHQSPCLPPPQRNEWPGMAWLRAVAWFVECTTEDALWLHPNSGKVHAPTVLKQLNVGLPDYLGRNDQWPCPPRRAVPPGSGAQIDPAPEAMGTPPTPTGALMTRRAAQALLAVCRQTLARHLMQVCHDPDQLLRLLLAMAGLQPSPHSHAVLHPEVQLHQQHWAAQHRLSGLTLWPSDAPPQGPAPNLARALQLLSPAAAWTRTRTTDLLVVCVVRNEMLMLPHFMQHYRQLGVGQFVFVDNQSDDGSSEWLLAQPDTVVYGADADYRAARYGVTWQRSVMAHHGLGKWVVAVDADELLVFPGMTHQTLRDWLRGLEALGQDAVLTPMVDMLPEGALATADLRQSAPFDAAPWFDKPAIWPWALGSGQFSNQRSWVSGLRHRLVPEAPPNAFTAQKIAVLRYQPWIHLADGLHYASNVRTGPPQAWLAHFKYHAGFAPKVQEEVVRQQHYAQAAEYRIYAQMLSETGGILRDARCAGHVQEESPLTGCV